jgi:hypothetical protein
MTSIYIRASTDLPERRNADHYPTEHNLIKAALDEFCPSGGIGSILDIGPGDGRWGLAAKARHPNAALFGIDVRELPRPAGFDVWHTGDYLTWLHWWDVEFDLILSNPPYYIAEKVIRRAWSQLAPAGTMVMLLRLAFQAGSGRAKGLWREIPPVAVGVCSRRPSFYGGGTNGTDYGIYVWRKDSDGGNIGTPKQWQTRLIEYERDTTEAHR